MGNECSLACASKIIGDMNESGRSLEVLFEACENAKVLTRLALDA